MDIPQSFYFNMCVINLIYIYIYIYIYIFIYFFLLPSQKVFDFIDEESCSRWRQYFFISSTWNRIKLSYVRYLDTQLEVISLTWHVGDEICISVSRTSWFIDHVFHDVRSYFVVEKAFIFSFIFLCSVLISWKKFHGIFQIVYIFFIYQIVDFAFSSKMSSILVIKHINDLSQIISAFFWSPRY